MTVDELIDELSKFRSAGFGDMRVVRRDAEFGGEFVTEVGLATIATLYMADHDDSTERVVVIGP